MRIAKDVEEVVRKQPMFTALTGVQLERVLGGMRESRMEEGQTLFHAQEAAERFFVLLRGRVKLYRLARNGSEKIIEIVRPGDSFAAAVMFMEQHRYPVSAEALRPSHVVSFENKTFLDILRDAPETCFRVMAELSRRLHQQVNELDKLSLQCAPVRLAGYLVERASETGSGSASVRFDAPKRDIASQLSIQPETFSRTLGRLSRRGLIEVNGKTVHVPNLSALQAYAQGSCMQVEGDPPLT